MRRLINNIISVAYSFIKFSLVKLFRWKEFTFFPIERFSPNVVTEFEKNSRVIFGKKVRVHSGCKIKVRNGGKLEIGNDVKINYYCIIACHDQISIGAGTEFGPSVYLYDHDHDYKAGIKEEKYKKTPISIGNNCWIGANTAILRGTHIGNNCVIGAGSIVKGDIPDNTIYVQERIQHMRSYVIDE